MQYFHWHTQAGGCLSAEMHRVQTDGTLGCPHVEPDCKTMRNVMMHPLLHTPSVLYRRRNKKGEVCMNKRAPLLTVRWHAHAVLEGRMKAWMLLKQKSDGTQSRSDGIKLSFIYLSTVRASYSPSPTEHAVPANELSYMFLFKLRTVLWCISRSDDTRLHILQMSFTCRAPCTASGNEEQKR